jgi:hypothetical protein
VGHKEVCILGNFGQEGTEAFDRSSSTAQLFPKRRRMTLALSSAGRPAPAFESPRQ